MPVGWLWTIDLDRLAEEARAQPVAGLQRHPVRAVSLRRDSQIEEDVLFVQAAEVEIKNVVEAEVVRRCLFSMRVHLDLHVHRGSVSVELNGADLGVVKGHRWQLVVDHSGRC